MVVFLTREGFQRLREEWKQLTTVRRPQILADLKQAREQGDLRENAAYDTAKLEQARTEGRIRELEALLKSARLIRWPAPPTKVDLGVQVTLENLATGQTVEYTVVASEEVGAGEGRISVNSPLGQALLGRRVGANVALPDRPLWFRILALRAADGTDVEPSVKEPAGNAGVEQAAAPRKDGKVAGGAWDEEPENPAGRSSVREEEERQVSKGVTI
jgi:transcription elongation factor GreA